MPQPVAAMLLCLLLSTAALSCAGPARRDWQRQAENPGHGGDAAREQLLAQNHLQVYPGWVRAESEHFVLLTSPDSPLAHDPLPFLKGREAAYERITRLLGVEPDGPITVLAYESSRQGQRLLGRPLAFALPERREMHVRWDQQPGHEETHVVAWAWNRRGCGQPFLEEGLAVSLSSHPGDPSAAAADLLARAMLPDLEDLIERFGHYRNGYVLAGSFVTLLLEEGGVDLVRRLYTGGPEDLPGRLEQLTGLSLPQLQAWWQTTLAAREPVTREPILEALSLLRLGQVDAAIGLLKRQRADLPESPVLEFALAQALLQAGDRPGAAEAYRRVLALPMPYRLAWMQQQARQALDGLETEAAP